MHIRMQYKTQENVYDASDSCSATQLECVLIDDIEQLNALSVAFCAMK